MASSDPFLFGKYSDIEYAAAIGVKTLNSEPQIPVGIHSGESSVGFGAGYLSC